MLARTGMDWYLAMFEFEVYSDDSGTHPNSEIAIAACYIASKKQWDKFSKDWTAFCQEEGLPFFHMAEFMAKPEAGHKPYCDWDNDKKNRVWDRVVKIINRRAAFGIAVGVPKESFNRLAPDHFKAEYAGDNYTYAVKTMLGVIRDWRAEQGLELPMQYVFDRGSSGQEQIEHVWNVGERFPLVARQCGFAPDGYGFQDKKIFKPLQAADILAWQWQNHLRKSVFGGHPERNTHPNFDKLRKIPMRLGFYSEQQMAEMFERFRKYEEENGKPAYLS